jgi:hypothetical protein
METSSPKVHSFGGASPEILLSGIELTDTIGKGTLALFVSVSHLAGRMDWKNSERNLP